MEHIIHRILIRGIFNKIVDIPTADIETFRKETAATFRVKPIKVQLIYDTIDVD